VNATPREAAEITVEGLVQGVGYRDFARRHAAELGLGGWVMNLPDGRVQIRAEGAREALDIFVERLRRGPRLARVDRLAIARGPASGGDAPAFTVRARSDAG
jgi:acylphosphatase